MRGTLCRCCRTRFRLGIIPAYVGNTVRLTFAWPETWDHPRVCGEHARNAWNGVVGWGSSPRMRGTHAENRRRHNIQRIIPAYAGNTFIVGLVRFMAWDHPRVCGEHATSILAARFEWGSSPRMRGTPYTSKRYESSTGIIPAYAGNTLVACSPCCWFWDHPRICGEHDEHADTIELRTGSSPHMRGTLPHSRSWIEHHGIIPAYAGNTCLISQIIARLRDHPRICGEHRWLRAVPSAPAGSSPHMRGTPVNRMPFDIIHGIIPAYAGNTYCRCLDN